MHARSLYEALYLYPSGARKRACTHARANVHTLNPSAFHIRAGKYSVPVLWDRKEGTIVNNESSEILRMFNRQYPAGCLTKGAAVIIGIAWGIWQGFQ